MSKKRQKLGQGNSTSSAQSPTVVVVSPGRKSTRPKGNEPAWKRAGSVLMGPPPRHGDNS